MSTDYDKIRAENIRGYGEFTHHLEYFGKLYADAAHFIFELLQNAEDAGAKRIRFDLLNDRLECLNDGASFSPENVRGICDIGRGTKAADLTQIGKFGIGFKSVYAHTEQPEVHSSDEHFRIEHYVRPYAVDPRPVRDPWTTLFVLPFHHPDTSFEQIRNRLERLDTRGLLFLKSLQEIEWSVEGGQRGLFIRESEPYGQAQLVRVVGQEGQKYTDEEWLLFERLLPLDWYSQGETIAEHRRLRVEVAFFVRPSALDSKILINRVLSSPLVVFFPTEKPTNLGFLAQGPYRTTPTRENVPPDDQWNRKLILETAELTVEALHKLRDMDLLTVSALETLPIRADEFADGSMFRPIFERVRAGLKSERLLPSCDGKFISAKDAKLARGADLRKLLAEEQLRELYGPKGDWKWLSDQITQDETPVLREYLTQELDIAEIDPEAFARQVDTKFLQRQSDEWMVRFYGFLNERKALWRASPYSAGPLRNKAIIRLEDGSQTAPFREGNTPNAYLPTAQGSDLPTVRQSLAAEGEALSFLSALGLSPPDPSAEVIERVIPKYEKHSSSISEDEHAIDIGKILAALHQVSQEGRQRLSSALKSCAFLRARNCGTSVTEFKKPTEVYLPSEDLERYFRGNCNAWIIEEGKLESDSDTIKVLGLKDEPQSPCRSHSAGYVPIEDSHSYHVRGLRGFDSRCNIDGLVHALQNVTVQSAEYIWNRLLPSHGPHICGTVQRSSRASYDPGSTNEEEKYSSSGNCLIANPWLPDARGVFQKPADLALTELRESFNRDEELARRLGMKPTIPPDIDQEALLRAAGLAPEAARFARQNTDFLEHLAKRPDLIEQIRAKLEESSDYDQEGEPLDYRAEIAETFSREDREDSDDTDGSDPTGPVPNPERRRQKLQEEIQAARGREPKLAERFTRVPIKVWELKNSAVRTFLEEQYYGRCQICDFTFPERNGRRYFEGVYLVTRTRARWIDRAGNVLCLCANCSAKFVHGEVLADDLLDQIDGFRTSKEGGPISPTLHIVLCGESADIRFTERHLLDLQQLVKADDNLADPELIETAEKLA